LNWKAFVVVLAFVPSFVTSALAQDVDTPPGVVDAWVFAMGEWDLVETRYSFEGELIETNIGTATFSFAMNGERLQEYQTLLHNGETSTALHLFVFDPRTEEIEIVRTDSGHFGFWTIIGKRTADGIVLAAKHPDPDSDVTRRITYKRVDDNHFSRQLEFSTNKGTTWFVRAEWVHTRKNLN
jgi:hypothetical protein